jgi:hypothetical protein
LFSVKDLRLMPSSHATPEIPPHVQLEVDAAWERAQDLFAGELELHFALDELTRRVTGELREPRGRTWQRVSATEALAIACGDVAVVAGAAGAARAVIPA